MRVSDVDIAALGARAEAMLTELAQFSSDPSRLVRLFLTPEHRAAADCVARWMAQAGLDVHEDALGTVRGRYAAADEQHGRRNDVRRLLLGSHLDTVIDAGKYDGMLGVVAGVLAVEHFAKEGRRFAFGIDVLAFGDEEGSRFPSALSSSSAIAGILAPQQLNEVDRDGVSFRDALRGYGKNPDEIGAAAYDRRDALAYVEVHIEQGPVLESEDQALGVVTAIVGQSRRHVVVNGVAGHAGTVPMRLRRDALAGAAAMVGALEAVAGGYGDLGVVATVGRLSVHPGATNVIPGEVRFTVDLRSPDDALRRRAVVEFETAAFDIAQQRGLALTIEPFHEVPTTTCDAGLRDGLRRAIEAGGGHAVALASGAGHDGQAVAHLCPVAMLFVRCRDGVSHNPAEFCDPLDMGRAIAALIEFIAGYSPPCDERGA